MIIGSLACFDVSDKLHKHCVTNEEKQGRSGRSAGVYTSEKHSDKTHTVLHHGKLRNILRLPSQANIVLALRPGLQMSTTRKYTRV